MLTVIPAAYFDAGRRLSRLLLQRIAVADRQSIEGDFVAECEMVIGQWRLFKADLAWLDAGHIKVQKATALARGKPTSNSHAFCPVDFDH